MTPLQAYFTALHFVRSTGAGVAETSDYPALAALLDAVGATLAPPVRCVGQLANFLGSGSPDFGLYSADQFPRSKTDPAAKPASGQKPARGVVEVKGPAAAVLATGRSAQVAKYLSEYGLVLLTNYRDFVLVSRGPGGVPVFGERYTVDPDATSFCAAPCFTRPRSPVRRTRLSSSPATPATPCACWTNNPPFPPCKPSAPPWRKPLASVSAARKGGVLVYGLR